MSCGFLFLYDVLLYRSQVSRVIPTYTLIPPTVTKDLSRYLQSLQMISFLVGHCGLIGSNSLLSLFCLFPLPLDNLNHSLKTCSSTIYSLFKACLKIIRLIYNFHFNLDSSILFGHICYPESSTSL